MITKKQKSDFIKEVDKNFVCFECGEPQKTLKVHFDHEKKRIRGYCPRCYPVNPVTGNPACIVCGGTGLVFEQALWSKQGPCCSSHCFEIWEKSENEKSEKARST